MRSFVDGNKDVWKWTLMIMQPEFVSESISERAIEKVQKKKNLSALSKLGFTAFDEGFSAQILHIGPYSEEKSTVDKIHSFIKGNGYELNGKHHEIYLGDPRKTASEKLKTILRQPIRKSNNLLR
jgi:hypothetical protein